MGRASEADPIRLFNRRTGNIQTEKVCARRWIDLIYGLGPGGRLAQALLSRPSISRLYGWIQSHPSSRRKIADFVRQYDIDLGEARIPPGGYRSFNDFFIRRLKPQARPIDPDPGRVIAPADSRLQVFEIRGATWLKIKSAEVTLAQLLGVPRLEPSFEGGVALVFRLAPCDYHRFGYVTDGIQAPIQVLSGALHSVNPLALRNRPAIHFTNLRHVCRIVSPLMGTVWQVEVGAMFVGSIVQHRLLGGPCGRGEEKGYFQFGGSTVIVLLEPGRVVIDPDIASYSAQGVETLVRYGESVGTIEIN